MHIQKKKSRSPGIQKQKKCYLKIKMAVKYLLSEKGKLILIFIGYEFYHDKTNKENNKLIYKCKNFVTCKSRLHVTNDIVLKEIGQHD